MREIHLTQGQVALVDDADYDWLNQWKWYACKCHGGNFYAKRSVHYPDGTVRGIWMSRAILGLEYGDKRMADHKNHNTLDNRRDNIRACTPSQNLQNRTSWPNSSSQFLGVRWHKRFKKWHASISTGKKEIHLGWFIREVDAACAYDIAAIKYHGEFANLNFPNRDYSLPKNQIDMACRILKTSHYRGVSFDKRSAKWYAYIHIAGRMKNLGLYDDEEMAAMAYDLVARKVHENHASLNFPLQIRRTA